MGKLDGKVALITGGASGIGAATVRLFAAEGARVMIADMQADKGREVAEELGSQGAFVQVNVTQESEVKAAIHATIERWGRLDCIYNNAGFGGALGPIESISVEDYDMTFDVLLKGRISRHQARHAHHEETAVRQYHQHLQRRRG